MTKSELQRLRSLREKKHREALGLFVVEGEKVVRELLAARFPFLEVYSTAPLGLPPPAIAPLATPASHARPTSPASTAPQPSNALAPRATDSSHTSAMPPTAAPRVQEITADEMARISHFPTPSPLLAVGRIVRASITAATLARGRTLALDGVQDAGNVGTLLRLADWFGFDRVVLSPDCADLFHQKVINASMGSFARVQAHTADLGALFHELRTHAAADTPPILGCDLAGRDVHSLPRLEDVVVVIGSEGRGLSAAVKAALSYTVTIPRYGHAESLNAAAAAAIVCAQLRQAAR